MAALLVPPLDVELVKPPSVAERYFDAKKYYIDPKLGACEDHYVLQHSNGVCVVGLAQSHPILRDNKTISEIIFKNSILKNKPSGKKKNGAVWLTKNSQFCDVKCSDGSTFILYACIRGSLYEINTNLIKQPHLLSTKPDSEGFIAIVGPKLNEKDDVTRDLLSQKQYDELPAPDVRKAATEIKRKEAEERSKVWKDERDTKRRKIEQERNQEEKEKTKKKEQGTTTTQPDQTQPEPKAEQPKAEQQSQQPQPQQQQQQQQQTTPIDLKATTPNDFMADTAEGEKAVAMETENTPV